MKALRQAKLLELVTNKTIETQEELTALLLKEGFEATQATVSRDIKEMNITKTPVRYGGYRYTVNNSDVGHNTEKLKKIFKESVTRADYAQNTVVIKTLPGFAPGACSAIDSMYELDIVGSLAGDDTAFLLMRTTEDASKLCEHLHDMLK